MKIRSLALTALILGILFSCQQNRLTTASPDNQLKVSFILKKGKPVYSVSYRKHRIILPSAMGFKLKENQDLTGPFEIISSTRRTFDEVWRPVWGTDREISNHFNELSVLLQEKNSLKRRIKIVFRVFNDGLGFRYEFPEQPNLKNFQITSEETYFRLTGGKAWWIPGDYDSYEFLYRHTPLAQVDSAATPFTVETKDGLFLSIHEAALYDYAGMTLERQPADSSLFKSKLVPWLDGVKVKAKTPFKTPWRTIMIADQPGKLIESHLIQNLNEPSKIEDTSWIKPMKYVGIWWGMHIGKWTWYYGPRHGATTENAKRYIDFASRHGIPGLLVEGWNKGWETWLGGKNVQDYTTPYPDFDLQEVVRYGKQKGVELIGHHESGGNVPEYERQIDDAFALYQRLGVPAVKTGYAGKMLPQGVHHHGQRMVRHYQMVIEKAAKHRLMIDAHEPIKDTGISRTWPNFLTREGARGMEYNAWSEGNPPEHTVILPFTRLLAGPMDYTPGIFNLKFDPTGNHRVYTTLAKQLAYYVVIYSPMQMAADLVENYENQPAFKFIEDVPVNWDESKALTAKIGDYLSVARRNGDQWYLGTITDEKARELKLSLNFLKPGLVYRADVYTDAFETNWRSNPAAIEIGKYRATADDSLYVSLSPSGGQAVRFLPVNEQEAQKLTPVRIFNQNQKAKAEVFSKIRPFGVPQKIKHKAVGKPVSLMNLFSEKYSAGGAKALTDGVIGDTRDFQYWQGYRGVEFAATIDLGSERIIRRIAVGFLQKQPFWAFLPASVTFLVSTDGKSFKRVAGFKEKAPEKKEAWQRKEYSKILPEVTARFIRVQAKPLSSCPSWHQGKGQKPWLFVDEIVVE